MDNIINKFAGLGTAGLVLFIVTATSGYAGGAALTAALATLGGPFGMMGGLFVLSLLVMTGPAISKYGIESISLGIINKLRSDGKSDEDLISDINKFPFNYIISKELRDKLTEYIKISR